MCIFTSLTMTLPRPRCIVNTYPNIIRDIFIYRPHFHSGHSPSFPKNTPVIRFIFPFFIVHLNTLCYNHVQMNTTPTDSALQGGNMGLHYIPEGALLSAPTPFLYQNRLYAVCSRYLNDFFVEGEEDGLFLLATDDGVPCSIRRHHLRPKRLSPVLYRRTRNMPRHLRLSDGPLEMRRAIHCAKSYNL